MIMAGWNAVTDWADYLVMDRAPSLHSCCGVFTAASYDTYRRAEATDSRYAGAEGAVATAGGAKGLEGQ